MQGLLLLGTRRRDFSWNKVSKRCSCFTHWAAENWTNYAFLRRSMRTKKVRAATVASWKFYTVPWRGASWREALAPWLMAVPRWHYMNLFQILSDGSSCSLTEMQVQESNPELWSSQDPPKTLTLTNFWRVGHGCSTVVEQMHHDWEVVGSLCFFFLFLSLISRVSLIRSLPTCDDLKSLIKCVPSWATWGVTGSISKARANKKVTKSLVK